MTRYARRLLYTWRGRLVISLGIIAAGLTVALYFGVPALEAFAAVPVAGTLLVGEWVCPPRESADPWMVEWLIGRLILWLTRRMGEQRVDQLGRQLARVAIAVQSGRVSALYPGFLARSLTGAAALIAGRKRLALLDEWEAHLAGESGYETITWPKVRQALGFVVSAARCRLADATDVAWRPADAVLGSRFLSNLFVWGPVIAVLVTIVHHDGRFGLVADDQDPVALGAFLYGAIRTGRWWRGVKPPEPKVRRAKE